MSGESLNFMALIELYVDQQRLLKVSFEEVENSEAKMDKLIESLQVSELSLQEMDSYLLAKANVENLTQIHNEYVMAHEKTRLQIMEILLTFPDLKKIHLNSSKSNPRFLLWDQEESTFTLQGFNIPL